MIPKNTSHDPISPTSHENQNSQRKSLITCKNDYWAKANS